MITKEQADFIMSQLHESMPEDCYLRSYDLEHISKMQRILNKCVVKPAPEFSSLHDCDQHCVTITVDQKDKMIELQFHNTQEYEKNSEWFTIGELMQLRDNINKMLEYVENENY